MRTLRLKLLPGSDLRQSVERISREENASGFILGVVGNLEKASFQCPGKSSPSVLEGNLEIITLNGTFSPEGVHLHLSLSDGDCQVWGGHLEPGTLINKEADILLAVIENDHNHSFISSFSEYDQKISKRVHVAIINNCPWSTRALRMLKSLDIPHDFSIIESDSEFQKLKAETGSSTFPQIFVDGEYIGGYRELSQLNDSGKVAELK